MANIYVRSSDGDNLDTGASWALAKATLAGAAAIAVAGDTIYVSSVHSETQATALTLAFAGTIGNPIKIYSVSDAAEPPVALLAGATIATTGASSITTSGFIHCEGLSWLAGDGAGIALINLANASNNYQRFRNCFFHLRTTSASSYIYPVNASSSFGAYVVWENCTFSTGSSSQRIRLLNGRFSWNGGGAVTSNLTTLIEPGVSVTMHHAELSNLDLSAMTTGLNLVSVAGTGITRFNSCKMPASWTGSIVSGTKTAGARVEAFNTDSGDTNYSSWIEDGYGSSRHVTSLYLSGTNGIKHNTAAVPLSYKMTAESTASYPSGLFEGMWRVIVNESTVSQVATLEFIHNEAAALTNAEIWMELDYPATSGSTQFTRLSNAKADALATAADQATSTADWDDGLTERANSTAYALGNIIKSSGSPGSAFICTVAGTSSGSVPAGYASATDGATITDGTATFKAMRRQKLTVTFTAAEQGVIRMRPVLAKASAVVWSSAKVSVA